ncbi:FxsA family protein [Chitinimonas naiadis]
MLLRLLPLFGLLLLSLPLMELAASVWLAQYIGWWLAFWLFASALVGIGILKSWRFATAWALVDSLRNGEVPLGRLFWVARTLVAALLFVFPGPISDVLGLILMLPWPGGRNVRFASATPAQDGVYEGEFNRVDEPAPSLPRSPGEQ